MDLLRKYMLSTAFLRAPDGDGAVVEPPASDPVAAAPEPAAPEGGDPEPPAAAEDGDPKPHGNKGKTPWYLDRISSETAARQQAEQRAADAEALAARLQRGTDPATPATPAPATPAQDIDALVNQRAQTLRLQEDSGAIMAAGLNKFGAAQFNETLAILRAVGAVEDHIVEDLIAVDKANSHEILAKLAQDPEKAASFAKLDPRRRIAELTRMSDALKVAPAAADTKPAAPAKMVSKAPAPAPAVDPSASKVVDGYADEASDEDFTRQFNERMKARGARR